MKLVLIIIFSIIISQQKIISQNEELDGFYKFKWGDSIEKVMSVMNSKATLDDKSSSYLQYSGGGFANLPVYMWQFKFFEKKLYYAAVAFHIPSMNVYSSLILDLIKKYGTPSRIEDFMCEWLLTYYKNDSIKFSTLQCLAGNGLGFEMTEFISLVYYDNELNKKEFEYYEKKKMDEL